MPWASDPFDSRSRTLVRAAAWPETRHMTDTDTSPNPQPLPEVCWQLQLLGQPKLVEPSTGRSIVLRAKDAALLAVIALTAPVKADHLAAMLWPAASARQADTSLR